MVHYEEFSLPNGLRVIVHPDLSTPLAMLNLIYDVGSRDEEENHTGFAHLFEHLMFGGSLNVPDFDVEVQKVGGENNAFTSTDVTNYYITVPAANIETAFWLESDRMMSLSFDPKVLEVQQKVVIEEFKQRYLNQPFGDAWLKLRPLAYTTHPYRWATIGKEIAHIEQATLDYVKQFFFTHYRPDNAVLVVSGNVKVDHIKALAEKWFGPIPAGNRPARRLPAEPRQTDHRHATTTGLAPIPAIYKAYHNSGRYDATIYAESIAASLLGQGQSSLLFQKLVKEQQLFNQVNAYMTGSVDPGLMVIDAKLNPGVELEQAEAAIDKVIEEFVHTLPQDYDLQRQKNSTESNIVFGDVELMNRTTNLAMYAIAGQTHLINKEKELYQAVTAQQVQEAAQRIFTSANSSTLFYTPTAS